MRILNEEECGDFICEKEDTEKDTWHKKESFGQIYNTL